MSISFTGRELQLLTVVTKGYASKRRLGLLALVARTPGLSVEELSKKLPLQYQATAAHLQKLERAELLAKTYTGLSVKHRCTKKGALVLRQLQTLLKTQ